MSGSGPRAAGETPLQTPIMRDRHLTPAPINSEPPPLPFVSSYDSGEVGSLIVRDPHMNALKAEDLETSCELGNHGKLGYIPFKHSLATNQKVSQRRNLGIVSAWSFLHDSLESRNHGYEHNCSCHFVVQHASKKHQTNIHTYTHKHTHTNTHTHTHTHTHTQTRLHTPDQRKAARNTGQTKRAVFLILLTS